MKNTSSLAPVTIPFPLMAAEELKKLKAVKKELLTDRNATFSSYRRCNQYISDLAGKYNTDTQTIFDRVK